MNRHVQTRHEPLPSRLGPPMTGEESKSLIVEIGRNHEALVACSRHRFRDHGKAVLPRVTCERCGGWMVWPDAVTYCRGFQAAGGNPDSVWPGAIPQKETT